MKKKTKKKTNTKCLKIDFHSLKSELTGKVTWMMPIQHGEKWSKERACKF